MRPKFIAFAIILGSAGIIATLWLASPALRVYASNPHSIFFLALTLILTVIPIRGTSGVSTLDISPLALLTTALLFGTAPAVLAAWISGVSTTMVTLTHKPSTDSIRIALNTGKRALCTLIAGLILWGPSRIDLGLTQFPSLEVLLRLLAAHIAFFSLSTILLSLGIFLRDGIRASEVWQANFGMGASLLWSVLPVAPYLLAIFYLSGGFILMAIIVATGFLGILAARDHIRISTSLLNLIDALQMARDGNLPHLKGETPKVASLATTLAKKMHLPQRSIQLIEKAATLHNIGYIALDQNTVLKPGKLSDSELSEIKAHPETGMRILREVEGMTPVAEIVLCHHESPDGSGYPKGLNAQQIPIEASIIKVAEAYIAMTHQRPHRPQPLSHQQALQNIANQAGSLLDPTVSFHFLQMMNQNNLAQSIANKFTILSQNQIKQKLYKSPKPKITLLPTQKHQTITMLKGFALLLTVSMVLGVAQKIGFPQSHEISSLGLTGTLFLIALLGLASIKPVRMPSGAYISAASSIVMLATLIGGPFYAITFGLATIAWALIHDPKSSTHTKPDQQINTSNNSSTQSTNGGITRLIKSKASSTKLSPAQTYGFVLSLAAVTSWCANLLANHLTNLTQSTSTASQIIPFLVSTTSFYSTESILISSLLATKQLSTKRIWQRNYLKSFPEPLTYSICGYAIFLGYKMLGLWATVPLFLFPTLWRHLALLRRLDLLKTHSSLIRAIAKTIDEKDRYTGGHSASVVEIATALAREMNLSERFVEDLEEAAIRHDLGKVSWPNQVLRKPERLNPHEEQTYKLTHPDLSAEIARRAGSSETVCQMIRYHHERWDGKGYPHRLKGNAIPLGARILCVADSFDAMIHDRWYRRKRTLQDAIDELIRCSATQFDPQVVDAFMRLVKRIDPEALVRTIEEEVSLAPVPATSEECIHAASSQYQETKPSHNDYIACSAPSSPAQKSTEANTYLASPDIDIAAPVSHRTTSSETVSDETLSSAST